MTIQEVAEALIAWVLAECPTIAGSYDHPPDEKHQALPDVACEVTDVETKQADERFRAFAVQQLEVRVFEAELLIVVDPDPAQTATFALYGFIDALQAAAKADMTLGSRVPAASPFTRASFRPPFVEFDDGSKGRIATLSIGIAEPLEV